MAKTLQSEVESQSRIQDGTNFQTKQEMQQSTYYGDDLGIKLDTAFEENFKELSKKVKNLPSKPIEQYKGPCGFPTKEEQKLLETNTDLKVDHNQTLYKEFEQNQSDIKKKREQANQSKVQNQTFLNLFGNQPRGISIKQNDSEGSEEEEEKRLISPSVRSQKPFGGRVLGRPRKLSHIQEDLMSQVSKTIEGQSSIDKQSNYNYKIPNEKDIAEYQNIASYPSSTKSGKSNHKTRAQQSKQSAAAKYLQQYQLVDQQILTPIKFMSQSRRVQPITNKNNLSMIDPVDDNSFLEDSGIFKGKFSNPSSHKAQSVKSHSKANSVTPTRMGSYQQVIPDSKLPPLRTNQSRGSNKSVRTFGAKRPSYGARLNSRASNNHQHKISGFDRAGSREMHPNRTIFEESLLTHEDQEMKQLVDNFQVAFSQSHPNTDLHMRKVRLHHPLFQHISLGAFKSLIEKSYLVRIPRGEIICTQGEKIQDIYFILFGHLGQEGAEEEDNISMGNTLGEEVLFSETKSHSRTIQSLSDVCMLQIPLKDFLVFGGVKTIGKGGGDGFGNDFEALISLMEERQEK